ncbi:hypothetical protein BHM03_00040603 [Ensete ventricosum]|nr:hypothetical protein BHM03_00040603 [Ensete ventricosum]
MANEVSPPVRPVKKIDVRLQMALQARQPREHHHDALRFPPPFPLRPLPVEPPSLAPHRPEPPRPETSRETPPPKPPDFCATHSSHHVPRGPSSQAFRHTVGFVVTWRSAAGRPASSFLFLVASAHQKREILTDRVGRDFESGPWKGAGEGRRVFIRTAAGDGSIFSFSDLLSLRLLPKVQKGTAMKWAVV